MAGRTTLAVGAMLLLAACSSSGGPRPTPTQSTQGTSASASPTGAPSSSVTPRPAPSPEIPICGSLTGKDVSGIKRCELSSHIVPIERTKCRNGSAVYLVRSPYVDLAFYAVGHHGLTELPATINSSDFGPYTRALVRCTGTHFPKK